MLTLFIGGIIMLGVLLTAGAMFNPIGLLPGLSLLFIGILLYRAFS